MEIDDQKRQGQTPQIVRGIRPNHSLVTPEIVRGIWPNHSLVTPQVAKARSERSGRVVMAAIDRSGAVAEAVAAHGRALTELAAARPATARAEAARAVELLRAALGPADPDVANVLLCASQIERAAGDLPAARAFALQAVTAATTWGLLDADLVSLSFEAELELATLDQSLGDLGAAAARLLDALTQARAVGSAQRSVLLLSNALGVAGRLDDAQRCYDEVYELLHASPSPDPADLAGLFHNLAGLAQSPGDAADGILWAERGIALRSSLGVGAGLDLARDYGGLGALHHTAGHADDARDAYAKAEVGTIAALGPHHHEVGVVLANQAALEADVGNPATAVELYRRARQSLAAALGPDHPEVVFVENNLRLLTAHQAESSRRNDGRADAGYG